MLVLLTLVFLLLSTEGNSQFDMSVKSKSVDSFTHETYRNFQSSQIPRKLQSRHTEGQKCPLKPLDNKRDHFFQLWDQQTIEERSSSISRSWNDSFLLGTANMMETESERLRNFPQIPHLRVEGKRGEGERTKCICNKGSGVFGPQTTDHILIPVAETKL